MKLNKSFVLESLLSMSILLPACIQEIQPERDRFGDEINQVLNQNLDETSNISERSKTEDCESRNPDSQVCVSYCDEDLPVTMNESTIKTQDVSGADQESRNVRVNYQVGNTQNLLCVDVCSLEQQELVIASNAIMNFVEYEQASFDFLINGIAQEHVTGVDTYGFNESECKRFKLNYHTGTPEYDRPSIGKESLKGLLVVRQNDLNTFLWNNLIFEQNDNHFYVADNSGHNYHIKTIMTSPSNITGSNIDISIICNSEYGIEVDGPGTQEYYTLQANEAQNLSLSALLPNETINIRLFKYDQFGTDCSFEINGNGNTFSKDDHSEIFTQETFEVRY